MTSTLQALDLARFYASRVAGAARPLPLASPVDLDALQTPALLVDLAALERNLRKMQEYLNSHGMGLRAHAKTHKCPVIAHRQMELGAIGICAAKLSEAEVMAAAGLERLLITSPLVSDAQLERAVRLAAATDGLQLVLDRTETADALQTRLAADPNLNMGVLIDLDPKMGRTGVACGAPALALARHLRDACPRLRLDGLQCYAGHCMHIGGLAERRARYREVMQPAMETRDKLREDGFAVATFSGGGTGTYNLDAETACLTDLQAGSYALMDEEYGVIGGANGARFDDFEQALFVLVSAISQPHPRLLTVDGGYKAFASDTVKPVLKDVTGVDFHWGGDEHGILSLAKASKHLATGDRLLVVPPHCDPTINLYDYCFPFRDGQVREIWPIAARGCSW